MANKISRIELDYGGIGQLLKSGEMRSAVEAKGREIASRAGSDYTSEAHLSSQRWNANVFPIGPEGYRDNLENNTLLKVLR